MLWWSMLLEFLLEDGFKLNPYDSCVANKTLPCRKQISICWYVDNFKISFLNKKAAMSTIDRLEARFGIMRRSFQKKHDYLGIEIEFYSDGSGNMWAQDHIRKTIKDFGEALGRKAPNPEGKQIFSIHADATTLPEGEGESFHSLLQKLL